MKKNLNKLFEGRLGRLHYFLGNLIILSVGTLVVSIYPNIYLSFFFTILILPLTVRRLHDIDLPGFLAPIGWLSYFKENFFIVAVIFNLFLLFKKGSKEVNKYGKTQKPKTKFIDAILNKKIKNNNANKKIHVAFKIIGWIFVVFLFLIAASIYGEKTTENIFRSTKNKSTTLYSDQVTIPKFTKYTDIEKESGFKFSILFPTNNPKTYDLNLKEGYIKNYQAHDIFNLEEKKFVQYIVNIVVPQEGKILSKEAKMAYLTNYPEGKIASLNGILIKKEITTFKGLVAVEYVFNSEMYETEMTHKGIAFIVDGNPIDLGIIYTSITPESKIYYDEYIKSFAISSD